MDHEECPYCSARLIPVEINNACGRYWYMECFECGWCGEEYFEEGFYFGDPDLEWDDEVITYRKRERHCNSNKILK